MNMGLGELMSEELEIEAEEAELLDAELAEGEEDPPPEPFDPGPAQEPLELNPVLRPRKPQLTPVLRPRKEVCLLTGKVLSKPAPGQPAVVWEDGSADYAPKKGTVTKPSAPPGTFQYPPPYPDLADIVKTVACPPPVEPPPSAPQAGEESAGKQPESKPALESGAAKVLLAVGAVTVLIGGALAYGYHRRSLAHADLLLGRFLSAEKARAAEEQARAAAQEWARTRVIA